METSIVTIEIKAISFYVFNTSVTDTSNLDFLNELGHT